MSDKHTETVAPEVRAALREAQPLPDDAALLASIRRGEEDADAGRIYSVEEVRRHLQKCLGE